MRRSPTDDVPSAAPSRESSIRRQRSGPEVQAHPTSQPMPAHYGFVPPQPFYDPNAFVGHQAGSHPNQAAQAGYPPPFAIGPYGWPYPMPPPPWMYGYGGVPPMQNGVQPGPAVKTPPSVEKQEPSQRTGGTEPPITLDALQRDADSNDGGGDANPVTDEAKLEENVLSKPDEAVDVEISAPDGADDGGGDEERQGQPAVNMPFVIPPSLQQHFEIALESTAQPLIISGEATNEVVKQQAAKIDRLQAQMDAMAARIEENQKYQKMISEVASREKEELEYKLASQTTLPQESELKELIGQVIAACQVHLPRSQSAKNASSGATGGAAAGKEKPALATKEAFSTDLKQSLAKLQGW